MRHHERLELVPEPESVRTGRHFLAERLTEWDLGEHAELAAQIATEALTNAVLHAGTMVVMDLRIDGNVVVGVTDYSTKPVLPPIAELGLKALLENPDLEAESGRGLTIIAMLADRWGIAPFYTGKTVWFALDLDKGKDHRSVTN